MHDLMIQFHIFGMQYTLHFALWIFNITVATYITVLNQLFYLIDLFFSFILLPDAATQLFHPLNNSPTAHY